MPFRDVHLSQLQAFSGTPMSDTLLQIVYWSCQLLTRRFIPHSLTPALIIVTLPFAHPVVLQQRGVAVFAARLLHKQLFTRGLVLVQHALPRIDHPDGERYGKKQTNVRMESDDL